MALVREPTDLCLPEEDVLIAGGVGENEILNGLYFRMNDTFGVAVYRLVKRGGSRLTTVTERFLCRDPKNNCWIIAPKAMSEIVASVGCAFVEDGETRHPGRITASWYVWHPASKQLKSPDEENAKDHDPRSKQPPVDQITATSIVGFEVHGATGRAAPGLMLRHGCQLYGRPVYESENGGQFLYWLKEGGSLEDGLIEGEVYESSGAQALFETPGHWIIGGELGDPLDSPLCTAYVADSAVTPDQLPEAAAWYVAVTQGTKTSFQRSTDLRLAMEAWARKSDMLAALDAQDNGSNRRTSRQP